MAYQSGWQKYAFFIRETTLGTPVTPTIWMPFSENPTLKKKMVHRGQMYTGVIQDRAPVQTAKFEHSGTWSGELYGTHVATKSIAEYLLEWATNGVAGDSVITPDGLTIEQYEPNSSAKRWAGCCCNSMTLAGADGGPITFNAGFNFYDQTDAVTPPSLVATTLQPTAFLFQDTTWTVGGSTVYPNSFSIGITQPLSLRYNNSRIPRAIIRGGPRAVTFQLNFDKESNATDALNQIATYAADVAVVATMKAAHLGTGASDTFTTVTIAFDRINFLQSSEAHPRDNAATITQDHAVLKPNTTDNDVDITYSLTA